MIGEIQIGNKHMLRESMLVAIKESQLLGKEMRGLVN